jgi:hypothetical protein
MLATLLVLLSTNLDAYVYVLIILYTNNQCPQRVYPTTIRYQRLDHGSQDHQLAFSERDILAS